jgi:hypothetical protein
VAIFAVLGENTQAWSSGLKKCTTCSVRFSLPANSGGKRTSLTFAAGFACCLLMLTAVFAQQVQPETAESDSLRGTVVNSVTREPIARALVFSPDNRFATLTDSEGHFEFTIPTAPTSPGRSSVISGRGFRMAGPSLMARKPGFLDDRAPGGNWSVVSKELTISLVPEALIVGHVLLPSSEAPDRIQVELYHRQIQDGLAHWVMQQQATTNSTGEFRFADLPAGSYKLLTRELMDLDPLTFDQRGPRFGYPPVYFPAAGDFLAAQTIVLSAGKTFVADITLAKRPYYPVNIPVSNGQAGQWMQVVVFPLGHRGPGYALSAGPDAIQGLLPSGTYTVEAAAGAGNLAGSTSLTVKGAPAEGASLALVASGSIPINVKEEFTNPEGAGHLGVVVYDGPPRGSSGSIPYLGFHLEPADDFEPAQMTSVGHTSGPSGEFYAIDNIRPGRYWLNVDSARGFASSVTSGGVDLQHEPLVVSGGSSPPIEVTMRDDWAEVDGTVAGIASPFRESQVSSFQTGTPQDAAAHVYFVPLPDSSGEFRETWVGRDGKFNLQQIPPGAYRVLAFEREQPEMEYRNAEAMRAFDSKGQVVHLVGNQKEQLQVQLISTSE